MAPDEAQEDEEAQATNAPTMNMSPWAKLMSSMMP